MLESNISDAFLRKKYQLMRCIFQAYPSQVGFRCFAHGLFKQSMEMERGETGFCSEILQLDLAAEVLLNKAKDPFQSFVH